MIFSFCQEQINDWAKLSGDYNPIHFDSDYARGVGLDEIVVHGMLPLVHIKDEISKKVDSLAMQEWLTIKALFKEPVKRDSPHKFIVKEKSNRNRFKLSSVIDENSTYDTIVGTYTKVASENTNYNIVDEFSIDLDLYREKKNIFHKKYPEIDKAWVLIDALTFSQFLNNEVPFSIVKKYGCVENINNQKELMSSALTVQTSHTLSIESSFFSQKIHNFLDPEEIVCKLIEPVIISSDVGSLTGLIQFNIYINEKFLMTSEVGLLVRFNFN